MQNKIFSLLVIILITFASGCGNSNSPSSGNGSNSSLSAKTQNKTTSNNRLVGTWVKSNETCTFKSDNTVVFNHDGAVFSGTYTIDGSKATIHIMGDNEEVHFSDDANKIVIGGHTYTKA